MPPKKHMQDYERKRDYKAFDKFINFKPKSDHFDFVGKYYIIS